MAYCNKGLANEGWEQAAPALHPHHCTPIKPFFIQALGGTEGNEPRGRRPPRGGGAELIGQILEQIGSVSGSKPPE